jgi:hypothetical protein
MTAPNSTDQTAAATRRVPVTTIVWATVVLILALVLVAQRISAPRANTIPIPGIDAPVDRILFVEGDDQLELRLRDGEWVIGEAEYPATEGVAEFLEEVAALEAADVVSARGSFADYGVGDDEGRRIRLFSGSTEPLAIHLGSDAAAGDGVYARLNGSREVVLLPRGIDEVFAVDPNELRETAMVRIGEEEIVQVEIAIGADPAITVVRGEASSEAEGVAWEVEPVGGGGTAGEEAAGDAAGEGAATADFFEPADFRSLFQELDPLRAETFLPEPPGGDALAVVRITRTAGDVEEIRIYPPDDDGTFPVTARSSEYPFGIPQWRARRLLLGRDPVS